MKFNESLQALLETKGWSLTKLSRETGIPKSTLHGMTTGTAAVKVDHLKKIANCLEVSVHRLLWGCPDPFGEVGEEILTEIFSGRLQVTIHRVEKKR